jgi:IclR family KDG regulon transcriptional repressor
MIFGRNRTLTLPHEPSIPLGETSFSISETKMPSKYPLLTLQKGLAVLELIADSTGDVSLKEISVQLQEPLTVIFRVLKTLSEAGYITQDPKTKRYRLGFKVWELSERAIARFNIVEGARPVLARLTQATGETSSLAILDGAEFLYIASVNGLQPLRAYVPPGSRTPLSYPTASGRVLLAYSKPQSIDEVLAEGLKRFTAATVTDEKRVRALLGDIRQVGIAVVHGEYQQQLSAIAAPIVNSVGDCIAAIAISGVTQHIGGTALPRLKQLLKSEAENLSHWLRGGASSPETPRLALSAGGRRRA